MTDLNPPISFSFPLTKDDHDHHHDQYHDKLFMISSSSTSSSIHTHDHGDDPRETHFTDLADQYNKVRKPIPKGGGSWGNPQSSSSFSPRKNEGLYKQDLQARSKNFSNVESATWMSSKVRLIHKMISLSDNIDDDDHDKSTTTMMKIKLQARRQEDHTTDPQQFRNNNNTVITRACSDCNTTTTPLWRTGPRGPKSLCNACGIRQRKARRAMAEAANGAVSGVEAAVAPAGMRGNNKEKKGRGGLAGTVKKQQCKQGDHDNDNKPFLKDIGLRLSYDDPTFSRVFPKDEEEAAFLLMELSCGLVHT